MARYLIAAILGISVVLFAHGPSYGDPPLTITDGGFYFTVVGDDQVPMLVEITRITDLRTNGGKREPRDNSPPEPPTEDESDFIKAAEPKVREWASVVADPQSAQGIAAVYSHVRGAVEDDLINTKSVWPVLKTATDSAIEITTIGKDWVPFRDKLSSLITEGQQRNEVSSKADIIKLMLAVQQGLELAADGSIALSMDKLTRIAKATNEAIDGN